MEQLDIGGKTPARQGIQRGLDRQQSDLQRAAIAMELLEVVERAALRATHLRERTGSVPSPEEGGPVFGRGDAALMSWLAFRVGSHVQFNA